MNSSFAICEDAEVVSFTTISSGGFVLSMIPEKNLSGTIIKNKTSPSDISL